METKILSPKPNSNSNQGLRSHFDRAVDLLEQKAALAAEVGTVKHKYVLEFDELPKSLVLNRTNARKLAEAWGKKSHSWIGQRVTLYGEDTSFGPGVRLRPVKVQKPLADDMNDEIPNL
jgi:hypothetical protein